jgi:hypothetical protein
MILDIRVESSVGTRAGRVRNDQQHRGRTHVAQELFSHFPVGCNVIGVRIRTGL